MTPSELKARVEAAGVDTEFFTRKTMKFFGDRMSNYGCRDGGLVDTHAEANIAVWELYRKRPVKYGLQGPAYFCKQTFRQVFPK